MAPSKWVFYYDRMITENEMKAIEELRNIEGQEVQVVYCYNGN
jgi:hypothetical protein